MKLFPRLSIAFAAALLVASAPVIAQQTAATPPKTNDNIVVKTGDAVAKGAKATGHATKEGLSKSGEVMTDEWITSRVHGRFVSEDLLKDSDISVHTAKHVVTLKGTVPTSAGRTRAGVVAKGTEGVHQVVNHITVGPKKIKA